MGSEGTQRTLTPSLLHIEVSASVLPRLKLPAKLTNFESTSNTINYTGARSGRERRVPLGEPRGWAAPSGEFAHREEFINRPDAAATGVCPCSLCPPIACALQSPVHALPHVAQAIEAYLVANRWTLESASKRGFFRLLDRLLKREWPGFNQKCRELRLKAGVDAAAIHNYDLRVLEWWLECYMPDQKVVSLDRIFELAIRHARIPVLEWLYQETNGDLPYLEKPATCLDPNTIIWLYEHGRRHSSAQLVFQHGSLQDCPHESIMQCLVYEEEGNSFTVVNAETAILRAIRYGQLEQVQWLYEHRPEHFKRHFLGEGVCFGRLDVVKLMCEEFPKHYFDDPQLRSRFFPSSLFDFETIRWVLCEFEWTNQENRIVWIGDAAKFCAGAGSLVMMKFLYQTRIDQLISEQEPSNGSTEVTNDSVLSPRILEEAAVNGHLAIIQWAYAQSSEAFAPRAMNLAAANGHLAVVEWLHQNRSDGCTTEVMNYAAANGHFEIVKWLHENRSEGCTMKAMDLAATGGHLDVVKWLHENRSEGCTTAAMNAAAAGHLNIVQWLCKNRDEGCTASAMTNAASIGHLDIVRFLHENRQEGCTEYALYLAAVGSHFDTFKWLYENRSESFYAPELNNQVESGSKPGPYLRRLAPTLCMIDLVGLWTNSSKLATLKQLNCCYPRHLRKD